VFDPNQYALVDFGAGRKLERFGEVLVDRPSPAAHGVALANPGRWAEASARYDADGGGRGHWNNHDGPAGSPDGSWAVRHGDTRLLLQLSASGNIGLFPEQAPNWDWIGEQVVRVRNHLDVDRPRVLNLFGYTGAASLAAAAAGAEVSHVDASAPTVAWARNNAKASGLAELPVRWLVEDAMKFVRRERRRQNRYHGIIVDPPTYGHGPKGRAFKFKEHLTELLSQCGELLGATSPSVYDAGQFVVFSCHAPGFGPQDARTALTAAVPDRSGARITSRPLVLHALDGRELPAGVSVRWSCPAR
jgi:23S rRNA (cytosine1962-C5)-methyltransferase